jgi:hypothetical protein
MNERKAYREEMERIQALDDVLITCALRMDGAAYAQQRARARGEQTYTPLVSLVEPVETEGRFHEDDLDNQAAFYALQRYLYNWGGERLTPWHRSHVVFRQLFLHCYRLDVPREYEISDYYAKWEREYRPRREEWAAKVRSTFRTSGDGPEVIEHSVED